jgi:hypothetical protein
MSGVFVRCIIFGMNTDQSAGLDALREGILSGFDRQKNYAKALVEDLSPTDMVSQPIGGIVMNHPAWVLSHLCAYMPVLTMMLRGGVPEDPIDHEFGRKSAPLPDAGAYLAKDELVALYLSLHDSAAAAFGGAQPGLLAMQTPIPRFVERFPTIASVAVQLMMKHESTHLGQVSAWRRAGGRLMVTP